MPWHAESIDQGETGHALLALLLTKDARLLGELARREIDPQAVQQALAARFPRRGRARERAETGARFIIEAMAAGKIDRDALVRSVLTDYWGMAGQVFREIAARGGPADSEAAAALEQQAGRPLVQLDDGADHTIYEQIVAQVQEAIATGRLGAGERLPTVRELADQLGIAPGTVARAYSELERQGTVVTQGVRGTRVALRGGAAAAEPRPGQLAAMLRPAVVAAFHQGASAHGLRAALDEAMRDIFPTNTEPGTTNSPT